MVVLRNPHVQLQKMPYFFNTETQQSTWEPPAGMTREEVEQLQGAHFLKGGAQQFDKSGQVRASHLLVKHSGSRRPASWKDVRLPTIRICTELHLHHQAQITRSKEEAIDILKGYQAEIGGSKEKFAELAQLHSDCSSHEKGGDLGFFGRGQMQKPFEDAAFGLEVGQMSDIISSDSGVHIVLRTA
ncbi:rotamase-domain-containing protein [Hymenopellis radicata]|nr:rotamase-domain-containing protein [Hymenopellis radicata]